MKQGQKMDLKSCSRCGKIHPRNYKCNIGRTYQPKTGADRLRSQRRWTEKAKQIKEDAQGLCEYCKSLGIYTYDNLEVHHITKLRDNPNEWINDSNLICLCRRHHKEADNGEIPAEKLRELAEKRYKDVYSG